MRITRIETFPVSYVFPPEDRVIGGTADEDLAVPLMTSLVVRVHTDEGISGLGEARGREGSAAMTATVERLAARFVDRDPFDVEKLTVAGGVADPLTNYALAGIDVALWDIVGKATNTPIYRLLAADGDVQPRGIRTYASAGVTYHWSNPDALVEEIARHRAQGFTAMKFRIGSSWGKAGVTVARFADLLRRAREAAGADMELMVDANGRLRSVEEAIGVGRALADIGARWFEEPLRPEIADGPALYNQIRAGIGGRITVSGGELFHTLEQHQPYLAASALDIVQPDAVYIGLTRAYRLARLYHALGRPCIPHSWTTAIAQAANAHLVAAIPNRLILETQRINNPLMTELVDQPIPVDRGFVDVPDRPGLGIELDEAALRRFPHAGDGFWQTAH